MGRRERGRKRRIDWSEVRKGGRKSQCFRRVAEKRSPGMGRREGGRKRRID